MPLRKLVLDVLKPIKGSSIVELAEELSAIDGVSQVSVVVNEMDVETVTLVITVEGNSINFNNVKEVIERLGGIIHSVDQVVASRAG